MGSSRQQSAKFWMQRWNHAGDAVNSNTLLHERVPHFGRHAAGQKAILGRHLHSDHVPALLKSCAQTICFSLCTAAPLSPSPPKKKKNKVPRLSRQVCVFFEVTLITRPCSVATRALQQRAATLCVDNALLVTRVGGGGVVSDLEANVVRAWGRRRETSGTVSL